LDDAEVRRALRTTLRISPAVISDSDISGLCGVLDADNSGSVSISELITFIGPEPTISRPRVKPALSESMASAKGEEAALSTKREQQTPRQRGPPLAPELLDKVRSKMKAAAYTGHSGRQLEVIFGRFDKDHSGKLEDGEVRKALRRTLRIPPSVISDAEISSLCAMLDADNSGSVAVKEIVEFVGPEPLSPLQLQSSRRGHDVSVR